ncbi:MAG: hypothetical protein ACRDRW_08160 [Pseudonocardiaceae bacterium]
MDELGLFTAALGLGGPWRVVRSEFDAEATRLDLYLDLFQHKALLHPRLPRVRCPEHGVRQFSVPWARPGSGFTLLFPGAGTHLRRGDTDGEGR